MNSMRQLGTALLYAAISVVLVVGGLSLALAEGGLNNPRSTPRPSPTLFSTSAPATQISATAPLPPSATPQIVYISATPMGAATQPMLATPTATATLRLYPTATRSYYPTPVHCGPYYGWVRSYVVQQGDTLFHISQLYRTTVTALQIANCLPGTVIYPGQLLWVPNVPTSTPGVTLIPTFPTDTAVPTEPLTLTPAPYFTETAAPTSTTPGP